MERIGETKGGTGRSGSGELGIVRSILASEEFMVLTRDDGGSDETDGSEVNKRLTDAKADRY